MIVNDHRDGPVLSKYQGSQRKHQGSSSTLEKKSHQDSPIVDLKQKDNTNKCSCWYDILSILFFNTLK